MRRTLNDMIASLPVARRRAVSVRGAVLIAEELSLRDLRKSLKLTQWNVAKRLKKGQDAVSRIEQRSDIMLSTLDEYVTSIGGKLELLCRFNDRSAVRLLAGSLRGKTVRRRTQRRVRA